MKNDIETLKEVFSYEVAIAEQEFIKNYPEASKTEKPAETARQKYMDLVKFKSNFTSSWWKPYGYKAHWRLGTVALVKEDSITSSGEEF